MFVDSHVHFWKYHPVKDAWITDDMAIIQRDFLPPDFAEATSNNAITGCIAVQADQSLEENNFLLDLADNDPAVKGVVGWLDLRDVNLASKLEAYAPKFCGVRHIVQAEKAGFMLEKSFQRGVSLLHQFGLTYDLLVYEHQLAEAIELLNSLPEQKIVLDHIGKPAIREQSIDNWRKHIVELSKREYLYCKVSGMVTEADWSEWKYADIVPYLDVVMATFGPDRLMYGSDWPVCQLAAPYKEVLELVEKYIASLSENEQHKIMGANALRFYGVK